MTGLNVGIIIGPIPTFWEGSFPQTSVTKAILVECKNLAVWVVQLRTRGTYEDSRC